MLNLMKLLQIVEDWEPHHKRDRVSATLKIAKDLEAILLETKFVWPDDRTFPPFLVPKDHENAEDINAVLRKSMEVQASSILGVDEYLCERNCFVIHGLLAYFFKHIPGKMTQNHVI